MGWLRIVNGVGFWSTFSNRYRDHFPSTRILTCWKHLEHMDSDRCMNRNSLLASLRLLERVKRGATNGSTTQALCFLTSLLSLKCFAFLVLVLISISVMDQFLSYKAILFPSDGMTFNHISTMYSHALIEGRPPNIVQLMTRWVRYFWSNSRWFIGHWNSPMPQNVGCRTSEVQMPHPEIHMDYVRQCSCVRRLFAYPHLIRWPKALEPVAGNIR